MKVILIKEVLGLGDPGEIVQVKDGYARNYLVPQKMAMMATKKNMAQVEAERKRIELQMAKEADAMQSFGKTLKTLELKLAVRAGEAGKLYGSVTNMDVASLIATLGHEVDRHRIIMEPIKKLGKHQVKVKLHPQVVVELDLLVEANNAAELAAAVKTAVEVAEEVAETVLAEAEAPAEA